MELEEKARERNTTLNKEERNQIFEEKRGQKCSGYVKIFKLLFNYSKF